MRIVNATKYLIPIALLNLSSYSNAQSNTRDDAIGFSCLPIESEKYALQIQESGYGNCKIRVLDSPSPHESRYLKKVISDLIMGFTTNYYNDVEVVDLNKFKATRTVRSWRMSSEEIEVEQRANDSLKEYVNEFFIGDDSFESRLIVLNRPSGRPPLFEVSILSSMELKRDLLQDGLPNMQEIWRVLVNSLESIDGVELDSDNLRFDRNPTTIRTKRTIVSSNIDGYEISVVTNVSLNDQSLLISSENRNFENCVREMIQAESEKSNIETNLDEPAMKCAAYFTLDVDSQFARRGIAQREYQPIYNFGQSTFSYLEGFKSNSFESHIMDTLVDTLLE